MLVQELHIRVQEGLRKLNSSVYQNLLPQQIDFLLNLSQIRLVKDRIKPQQETNSEPFEQQKVYDDIQNLIEEKFELPTFVSNTGSRIPYSFAYLPSDYLGLASDASLVYDNCTLSQAQVQATTNYTEAICYFTNASGFPANTKPFQFDNAVIPSSPPFYKNLQLQQNGGVNIFQAVSSTTTVGSNNEAVGFGTIYTGYSSQKEAFYCIDWILEFVNRRLPVVLSNGDILTGIYWEQYSNTYVPNTFLLVIQRIAVSSAQFVLSYDNKTFTSSTLNSTVYQTSSIAQNLCTEVSNRLVKPGRLNDVLSNNYFYKTSPLNPVSYLESNKINVYFDKRFIVNKIIIDYIRKPRRIDLNLNQTSELKESLQYELIDYCIEYAKMTINNPTWKDNLQDSMLRSQ